MNTNLQTGAFRHIFVPLDGSPTSLQAVPHAIQFGIGADKVTLLQVIADTGLAGSESLDRIDRARSRMVEALPDATVTLSIVCGEPVDEILRAASEIQADLVIMGHLDREPGPRRPITSVSGRVASRSHVPVLVVRTSPGETGSDPRGVRWSRIVLPLDGSLRARQCLPVAETFARILESPVHLVTVIDPLVALPPAYAYSSPALDGDRYNAIRALEFQGNESLQQAEQYLAKAGIETTAELLSGPVTRSILDTLREDDLLILSSRGDGQAVRDKPGTVARGLIKDARNPVVMFHPELPTSEGPSGHPEWVHAGAP